MTHDRCSCVHHLTVRYGRKETPDEKTLVEVSRAKAGIEWRNDQIAAGRAADLWPETGGTKSVVGDENVQARAESPLGMAAGLAEGKERRRGEYGARRRVLSGGHGDIRGARGERTEGGRGRGLWKLARLRSHRTAVLRARWGWAWWGWVGFRGLRREQSSITDTCGSQEIDKSGWTQAVCFLSSIIPHPSHTGASLQTGCAPEGHGVWWGVVGGSYAVLALEYLAPPVWTVEQHVSAPPQSPSCLTSRPPSTGVIVVPCTVSADGPGRSRAKTYGERKPPCRQRPPETAANPGGSHGFAQIVGRVSVITVPEGRACPRASDTLHRSFCNLANSAKTKSLHESPGTRPTLRQPGAGPERRPRALDPPAISRAPMQGAPMGSRTDVGAVRHLRRASPIAEACLASPACLAASLQEPANARSPGPEAVLVTDADMSPRLHARVPHSAPPPHRAPRPASTSTLHHIRTSSSPSRHPRML
ncbi:hypothetical protein JB92DRAFT_2825138 [Gautieria morchelliformis]|nr:hypothetical protein JB92DRAFT_2825138 [Gautieria morchelliformis]